MSRDSEILIITDIQERTVRPLPKRARRLGRRSARRRREIPRQTSHISQKVPSVERVVGAQTIIQIVETHVGRAPAGPGGVCP